MIFKFFKNEKGSSIVMVLSVIIIMTMLGSVALVTSASNYKLGNKYKLWTDKYYELDGEGDENLNTLDILLSKAERYTQYYIQNECYIDISRPSIADENSYDLNAQQHDFIYNGYLNTLTTVSEVIGTDEAGNDVISERTYMDPDDLEDFLEEAYKYLYYFYSYNLLDNNYGGYTYDDMLNGEIYDGQSTMTWGAEPSFEGIRIEKLLDDGDKEIKAVINIEEPEFTPNMQDTYYTFKGNPLWGNAIAAGGKVEFLNDVTIYGDIVSTKDTIICNGNNVDVQIYGNIYSNDDIIVSGDNSGITVNQFIPQVERNIKNKMFGENKLFFKMDYTHAPNYTEDVVNASGDPNNIPFIYNDINGGNVYCNTLKIDNNSQNADIEVTGHIWTYDDIELDGNESTITVNGNYVGINSEASEVTGNPNASSSIINNKYEENSVINLNGNIIVPGVAFIHFDKRTYTDEHGIEHVDDGGGSGIYYRLAESVSAKNPQIFYTYSDDWTEGALDYGKYTLDGDNDYYLKEDEWGNFLDFFIANIQNKTDPGTNINVSDDIKGYTTGSVCAENSSGFTFSRVISGLNDDAYSTLSGNNELIDIFESKTKMFGLTSLDYPGNIAGYVDKTVIDGSQKEIVYLDGDKTLTLNGNREGIIYCTGNLTVNGTGEFKGTIIAEGDISISGGITIHYDEEYIAAKIVENELVNNFFVPGAKADYVYYRKTTSSSGQIDFNGGSTNRFKVIEWTYE